jgi:MFS transporter, LAT3 family, solute carrier family 43, member 3
LLEFFFFFLNIPFVVPGVCVFVWANLCLVERPFCFERVRGAAEEERPIKMTLTTTNGEGDQQSSLHKNNKSESFLSLPAHSPVSPALRLTTNILALVSVFFFSGIIFGWAPLELLLLQEGQYSEVCPIGGGDGDSTDAGGGSNDDNDDDDDDDSGTDSTTSCAEQRNKLSFIFTMAQFTLSFSSLPVGFVLDKVSKSKFILLTALIEMIGLISFGLSESSSSSSTRPDLFLFGYCCMALGGCMSMLGAFPASFLLPRYQAGILASISCLFDGSSAVFFGFLNLYQNGNGMTRQSMFSIWAFLCGLNYIALSYCWYLCEERNWQRVVQQESDEADDNDAEAAEQDDDDDDDGSQDEAEKPTEASSSSSVLAQYLDRIHRLNMHEWPVSRQVFTPEFALALIFASIHMLRCNYFIMTVDGFLWSIGDTKFVYAKQFSWMLPCGIIFVPVIEYTLTHWGVVSTLHLANFIGFVFGVLSLIPFLPLQVVNFGVFTCFRAYLYATLNTVVAITFGVQTMGRMIGCTFATAAVVSLAQYPAILLTETVFQGNFTPMNTVMLGLCVLPFGMALWYVYFVSSVPTTSSSASSFGKQTKGDYGSIPAYFTQSQRMSVTDAMKSPSLLLASPGAASLSIRNSSRSSTRNARA